MRTRSYSNIPVVSPPNPSISNPKRRNRRRSKQHFILEESLVDTMADQRTLAELLRAPTKGGSPSVARKRTPMRSILTWENLVSKFINEFFPPSRTTNLRNKISNFQQLFDLLRACPHHGFTELHQLDTFYNALNPDDQDSLNSAAGGNLLERRTQDVLTIIENKSKVRNSRNKSVVSQVKSCDASSNSSSEIAKLTHAVNKQTSVMTIAMTTILKQFQATPPSAFVKAVEEIYVTCGEQPYQAPTQQNQIIPLNELEKVKRMNDANMKAMQTQINNVKNELRNEMKNSIQASMSNQTNEIKNMMVSLFQMDTASTSRSGSLPSNTVANPKGELKAITTRSGIVLDGPFFPIPPLFVNPEVDERVEETLTDQDLAEYTIKVPGER
nr:reverse transcriptase domain-containing protein [Tanacetum cinerariifolium]GEZ20378.1 reverse transcriptase domain-containing protein [Tanacetum cinerariifolium]